MTARPRVSHLHICTQHQSSVIPWESRKWRKRPLLCRCLLLHTSSRSPISSHVVPAMPTHTPSPHRFLAPSQSSSKSAARPQSNLRNALTSTTPKANFVTHQKSELQFKKITPAKRFVVAPVHHKHKSSLDSSEHEPDELAGNSVRTQVTPRLKPKRPFERVESIEEASQSSLVALQDEEDEDAEPFVEHDSTVGHASEEDQNNEMLFQSVECTKRRRVSPPSSPPTQPPKTPISMHSSTNYRFKPAALRTPAPSANLSASAFSAHSPFVTKASASGPVSASPAPQRPQFLLPALPTSPPKPSKPLPEIFSPSRKTERYLPGGLASIVTAWIIETANTGFAAQTNAGWGHYKEDGVKLRVRISAVSKGHARAAGDEDEIECYTSGVAFVRGMTEPGLYNSSRAPCGIDDEAELRILLAGQGGARGAGVKIRVGSVVGIRQPMWDIEVAGEKWLVGVDWVVL